MNTLLLLLVSAAFSFSQQPADRPPLDIDDLAIEVVGASRTVAYTNKNAGVFSTETNAEQSSAWQGWRIMSHQVLDDYRIVLDGEPLLKAHAGAADVLMYQLHRKYPTGVIETVTLLDSIDAILVKLHGMGSVRRFSVFPLFREPHSGNEYVVKFVRNTLLVARTEHPRRTPEKNYPVWVGLRVIENDSTVLFSDKPELFNRQFAPAGVQCDLKGTSAMIVIVAGDTEESVLASVDDVSARHTELTRARKERITKLLSSSMVETDNLRFDRAMFWAKASLDALIMNQGRKGIFAGLPWFDNYWGRDSFIALPGATLVTGNFSDARGILSSFAAWQDTNSGSSTFGRIPNLVTTTSTTYNTADGTPRFVIALLDYLKYTNDSTFVRKLYPVVRRAMAGALRDVDSMYFIEHGDAETWMDAVGPEGAWSPRGNRANDVQSLWHKQLVAGSILASHVGDSANAARWRAIADTLALHFRESFVDSTNGVIIDHLNSDGTADTKYRPNQLFALDLAGSNELRAKIFRNITERLVYKHGVGSLAQDDREFHPYHHFPPYYVQDAAYHNGIVWTWLAGPWIDLATEFGKQDLAFKLTEEMAVQILHSGAIGTVSELLEAAPRSGEHAPRFSGTFSQAWSLSEFIRSFYQSYLGVHVDAQNRVIKLAPRLPRWMTKVRFTIAIDTTHVEVEYDAFSSKGFIGVKASENIQPLTINGEWMFRDGSITRSNASLVGGKGIKLSLKESDAALLHNVNSVTEAPAMVSSAPEYLKLLSGLALAVPKVPSDLPALKKPSHRILTNAEIKRSNQSARILYDVADPEGDDVGSGKFTYPLTTHLKPGSLDITRFSVSADQNDVYFSLTFKNLSDPGWHPEYGFQLTYVAIAIDKDGRKGSGERRVGMNARMTLPEDGGYEAILYVGGGIRVVDAAGKILGEYLPLPGDEHQPLGNISARRVTFSIPRSIIRKPSPKWRYAVLVGSQDDHGGAGIGEFRSVEVQAGEWTGGGKNNPTEPNVYDFIMPGGE